MRILCLDIGERRIGVAVSDETGLLARGLATIERDGREITKIRELTVEYRVERIVYGLPLKMDGSFSAQTEKILAFADELKKQISLPLVPWDERLTTKEAETILITADISRQKRKRLIDKLAAQIILQDYLESERPPEPEEEQF